MEAFSISDLESILTSLRYSKMNLESKSIGPEGTFPDYATKRAKLDEVEKLIEKVRTIKNKTGG